MTRHDFFTYKIECIEYYILYNKNKVYIIINIYQMRNYILFKYILLLELFSCFYPFFEIF